MDFTESSFLRSSHKTNRPPVYTSGGRGWNDKLEETVKTIGENARTYKLMHLGEAQKASIFYNRLTALGIFLGPMSSIISTIETTFEECNNPFIDIISIVLAFLAGVVVGIIKFGKYEERISSNKNSAAKFNSIETDVRRQLGMYRHNRSQADEYIEWLQDKYETLSVSSPLLPLTAYAEYREILSKFDRKSKRAHVLKTENKEIEISCLNFETTSDPGISNPRRSTSPMFIRPLKASDFRDKQKYPQRIAINFHDDQGAASSSAHGSPIMGQYSSQKSSPLPFTLFSQQMPYSGVSSTTTSRSSSKQNERRNSIVFDSQNSMHEERSETSD